MMMNAELQHRIDYELMMLENARKEYALRLDHLKDYKGSYLRRVNPGKKKYYYLVKHRGSKTYQYLGLSGQQEITNVREVRFLEEAIRRIDRNIALMKTLADGFISFDPSSICESLPKIYRCKVPPVSDLYEREGARWKADRLKYQKRFPENYPENKRHTTTDRVKVKTISELTLYEMFKTAGLALVYELPLAMNDYGPPLYPDFTILSPVDMKTEIIVEFAGRLDSWSYCKDFGERLSRYINNGYIPGVNLFFVFGDKDGNIDSAQIERVIAEIKGLRNVPAA
ncbi:MAG: hypothetical protein IKG25_00650 [Mogibacterium sp.]|nr:hypothetical protein [Mogibacterium sp.]